MVRKVEGLVRLYRRGSSWWAEYREKGVRTRRSLKTPHVADARLMASKIEEELRGRYVGIVDKFAQHGARPIAEHVADFRATMEAKGDTAAHVERVLAYLEAGLAAMDAQTARDLDVVAADRWLGTFTKAGLSARAVNVRAQALRWFGVFLHERRRVASDPFLGITMRTEAVDRRRVRRALTAEETVRLLDAARRRPLAEAEEKRYRLSEKGRARLIRRGEHRALLYAVVLSTGLRRGEASRVRWRDVDLERGLLVIPAASAKARKDQEVPLSSVAQEALSAARTARGDEPADALVFPPKDAPTAATFARDLLHAGIRPRAEDGTVLDFHGLRTTLATRLSEANVPLVQAQRILRHSTPTLTSNVYSRPVSTDLRAALDRAALPRVPKMCPNDGLSRPESAPVGPMGDAEGAPSESAQEHAERPLEASSRAPAAGGRWRIRTSDVVRVRHSAEVENDALGTTGARSAERVPDSCPKPTDSTSEPGGLAALEAALAALPPGAARAHVEAAIASLSDPARGAAAG